MTAEVRLARGSLHLPREVYERHLGGRECVVLLRDGPDLLVLPVRGAEAGGLLLKVRNAAGDRVVDAADFLRAQPPGGEPPDLPAPDLRELAPAWRWDDERASLRLLGVFPRRQLAVVG